MAARQNYEFTANTVKGDEEEEEERGWIVTFDLWRIDANKVHVIKVIITSQITEIKCSPKMMKIKTMVYVGITFSRLSCVIFKLNIYKNLFIYKYIVTKWHYLSGFFLWSRNYQQLFIHWNQVIMIGWFDVYNYPSVDDNISWREHKLRKKRFKFMIFCLKQIL